MTDAIHYLSYSHFHEIVIGHLYRLERVSLAHILLDHEALYADLVRGSENPRPVEISGADRREVIRDILDLSLELLIA